jgi:O-acetyl-ADP-ribose deacetylase (regulator of RNase III)
MAIRSSKVKEIRELYYITHKDNINSILQYGILSHSEILKRKIKFTPIYDEAIVSNRAEKKMPKGESLWEYANIFFQPRNPMMYRVKIEKTIDDIAIIGIKKGILEREDLYFTNGNAACGETQIFPIKQFPEHQFEIRKQIDMEYWNNADGSKRRIMAECLVPKVIEPNYLEEIYVTNCQIADEIRDMLHSDFPVLSSPELFFEPQRRSEITNNLSIVDGDMFFSRMQTLTVSVNCVGIMGKGLASRAKRQFPDVYVKYQDACRSRALKMGKPFLYKREASFDNEIADEPCSLTRANAETWFLLFATKRKWWDIADFKGIEEGLKWIKDNYHELGIKSLALPALGCGLGRLNWQDVGPLLCKYLSTLDIPVQIYLPAEKSIPEKLMSKGFLLGMK